MRAILWEASAGALDALLASRVPLTLADLFTVTLADGQVFRWSGADVQVQAGASTWVVGPGLRRGPLRWAVGVEVDRTWLEVTDNLGTVISGRPLLPFIVDGGFQEARVAIARAFWPHGATSPTGVLRWFDGRVSDVSGLTRFQARLELVSDLELLNQEVPRDVFQAACLNTVFDSACGLARSSWTVAGVASGASDATQVQFPHALGLAAGYLNLGKVWFTSGANAGAWRTIRSHTSGLIVASRPWRWPVVGGDAFSVVPGCDGLQATCSGKFSNLPRFRGQPYVPEPQSIT